MFDLSTALHVAGTSKKATPRRFHAIFFCVALLFAFCGSGPLAHAARPKVATASSGNGKILVVTGEPTPTPTPTPEETPTPTETPQPTETPKPSLTPKPTETP